MRHFRYLEFQHLENFRLFLSRAAPPQGNKKPKRLMVLKCMTCRWLRSLPGLRLFTFLTQSCRLPTRAYGPLVGSGILEMALPTQNMNRSTHIKWKGFMISHLFL